VGGPALLLDWMKGSDSVRSLIRSIKFRKGILGVGESGLLSDADRLLNRARASWPAEWTLRG
jgi:hypothetical protein